MISIVYVGWSLRVKFSVAWKLRKTNSFVFCSFQATKLIICRLQPTYIKTDNKIVRTFYFSSAISNTLGLKNGF